MTGGTRKVEFEETEIVFDPLFVAEVGKRYADSAPYLNVGNVLGVIQRIPDLTCDAERIGHVVHVCLGSKFRIRAHQGSGNRNWWYDWEDKRQPTAFFSDAVPTSRGGGQWQELEIWEASAE